LVSGKYFPSPKVAFDFWKRGMDVVVSFVLGILTLIIMPFVALAIKLEDGGVIFSKQQRIGKNNQLINIVKFRTMTVANDGGNWGEVENKVTKVGRFLRKSRLDEFPQVWNVLKGDISLIGPRPEFSDAVKTYADQIPYYNIRHIIKPGLSGWAQIYGDHPHHDTDITKTKNKLSYDLYYIKNRSSMVDLKIALRTLQVLISQRGK
jgi:lipopolysaccharide/colanic/teichoic acid biosynthesis glycosyltransferase